MPNSAKHKVEMASIMVPDAAPRPPKFHSVQRAKVAGRLMIGSVSVNGLLMS